ncbi:MAG: metallophosphoesterase [Clostridia bacterium]|nr:metallophosphoesterase [Clostridia bacterium]
MLRFIYTTDSHGRGSNPVSRLDDFPTTILNKFKWINEKAEELGAAAILHGGDWLESPDVANSFVRELTYILSHSKVPWYGILGNHDIYGQNPETFKKTPLGIAEAAGAFTRLSDTPTIFKNGNTTVSITGKDSYFDLDKKITKEDYINSAITPGAVNIHIVHGFLDDCKWQDSIDCTTIDEVINCNADILLTGHVHQGFGIKRINNKIFCNPNALARTTASVGDVNNEVRIALITVDGMNFDVELISLPTTVAKPANEVLDRAKLVSEKEHKKQLEKFINSLNKGDIYTTESVFNIYNILNIVAKEDSLDDNIISITRQKLEQAEEELKKSE